MIINVPKLGRLISIVDNNLSFLIFFCWAYVIFYSYKYIYFNTIIFKNTLIPIHFMDCANIALTWYFYQNLKIM